MEDPCGKSEKEKCDKKKIFDFFFDFTAFPGNGKGEILRGWRGDFNGDLLSFSVRNKNRICLFFGAAYFVALCLIDDFL